MPHLKTRSQTQLLSKDASKRSKFHRGGTSTVWYGGALPL